MEFIVHHLLAVVAPFVWDNTTKYNSAPLIISSIHVHISVPSTSKFSLLFIWCQCSFVCIILYPLVTVNLYSLCFRVSTSPQSEIEQLQTQLVTEQKRVLELNREIASSENRLNNSEKERNVLQHELDRLRQSNEELQAELSEAQQQLAKMEASMKKATNTATALKKVAMLQCFYEDQVYGPTDRICP